MKHQDIDPSLLAAEPAQETLDGGFSPPAQEQAPAGEAGASCEPGDLALATQSPF
jgi:hypothetical protein